MPPAIASPLRILHLSTPSTPHPALLKDKDYHDITNPYYTASIPIWHDDDAPTSTPVIDSWKQEWKTPEAGEVVQAIGAWIVCFRKPRIKDDLEVIRTLLSTISAVIEYHGSSSSFLGSEPLLLAVGMQQSATPSLEVGGEEWEDLCRRVGGWEWIDGTVVDDGEGKEGRRNEFGEKVGLARMVEALEANEWDAGGGMDGLEDGLESDDEDGGIGLGQEAAEMQTEMWGLQSAVRGEGRHSEDVEGGVRRKDGKGNGNGNGDGDVEDGGDEGVQGLEAMMLKMQAVRDMGADMPEAERRNFAAKAVRNVLKQM